MILGATGAAFCGGAYRKVECLTGSGKQYIDTGIENSDDNIISIDCDYSAATNLFGLSVSGWATNSANNYGTYIRFLLTNKLYNNYLTGRHVYEIGNISHGVVIDGARYEWSTDSGNGTRGNVCIFICKGAYGAYDLYSFGIGYGSANSLRNMIPCVRTEDSEPGLYDRVSGAFFTNSGTGKFGWTETSGAVVKPS